MAWMRSEQFVQHATFARVNRDEVKDETVLLLTVTVDSAHALLQPNGIPRDVIIDHQPAELEIDTFTSGFGGDEHLGRLAKLALGENARAGRVAVANLSSRRESG